MNSRVVVPDVERLPATAAQTPVNRISLGWLAIALPPLVLLVDTAVSLARGWRIESRLDRFAVGALVMWLAAATALLALAAARRSFARRWAQFVLVSVSLCGAWLVAELALGPILANFAEPFHCRRPGLEFVYRPRPGIMRDVGGEAHVRFNSWGVRGGEPPARGVAYRILCLGGSSTACTYLDDSKTWPKLLENNLQTARPAQAVWVGNAGLPGFRVEEHLQFVEASPLVDEIDCLVVQAGINDFMACLAGPRPAPPLWTQSRVWQLAGKLARRYAESGTFVEDTAGSVYTRRRLIRSAAEIDSREPAIEPCLRQFGDKVRQIIDACQRRGVRVLFTTQAVLWRSDLDAENAALLWFGQMSDGKFLAVDQLRRGMDRYNDVLRAACTERGVELVDLSQLDGDESVFYDDCHFTETGAARAARLIADWFRAHPAPAVREARSP